MFDVTCKVDGIKGISSNDSLFVQSVKDKKARYGAVELTIAVVDPNVKSITVDGFELAQAISNCQRNEGRRVPSYYRPRYNDDSEESEE